MDKVNGPMKILVVCFINSEDKNIRFYSFQELMKEGNVSKCVIGYKRLNVDGSYDDKVYVSKRILKLDLFNKVVTTVNGKVYEIQNDIYVDFIKRRRKRKINEAS